MTRALTSGFAAAVAAGHVHVFPLVDLGFASGTVYLCGLDHPVTYAGNTYSGALGLMGLQPLEETDATAQGLSLTLAGVLPSSVALVLAENPQGRPVTVRMAVVDAAGVLHVDANVWSGSMDTLTLEDRPDGAVLTLTAEHMRALWDRPRPLRYTDAAQQALHPGDRCCEFVATLAEAQIVWPGRAFFMV